MSNQSIADLPEIEYLDGRAHPKVSPKYKHGIVHFAMARIIHAAAGERGRVVLEWRLHVGGLDGSETSFVPDIAYVAAERLRALSEQEREEPALAPDIAVEIWSPSNDRRYLEQKIARYLSTGSD
jgi:Uma2 family endonuclease